MQLSSDLPSAMAVEERRELTQLPSDLLSHILNACTDLTAAQLSSTCKRWLEVFNADGSRIERRAIGSLLSKFTRGLKPEHLLNSTRHGGPPWPRQLVKGSADISWGELALRLKSALAKLESMKSPGCQYQKYLRWLQGEPASSPTVVRGLLGVSMLPTSLADTVRLVPTAPQGKGAPRWPFLEIDDDHGQHSVPAESEDTKRTDWTLAVKRGLYVALSGAWAVVSTRTIQCQARPAARFRGRAALRTHARVGDRGADAAAARHGRAPSDCLSRNSHIPHAPQVHSDGRASFTARTYAAQRARRRSRPRQANGVLHPLGTHRRCRDG